LAAVFLGTTLFLSYVGYQKPAPAAGSVLENAVIPAAPATGKDAIPKD